MKYRRLGNTGVIVSEVALGTMQFGGKMNMGNLGQEATTKMVKLALDRGINFIDTADVYSRGESETLLGNALKGIREEIVLATKVRLPMSDNFNRSGATRVNIMRGIESSLKRLQTDHVDLYQVHGWDSNTPLEETLRTLDDVVRQGKIALHRPEQPPFLAGGGRPRPAGAHGPGEVRHGADVLQPRGPGPGARVPVLCPVRGLGILVWSPLAGGFLAGKYTRANPAPAGTRSRRPASSSRSTRSWATRSWMR